MKKKEMISYAKQIFECETIIQNSDNAQEVEKAKEKILNISGKISFEDMIEIDDIIMGMMGS